MNPGAFRRGMRPLLVPLLILAMTVPAAGMTMTTVDPTEDVSVTVYRPGLPPIAMSEAEAQALVADFKGADPPAATASASFPMYGYIMLDEIGYGQLISTRPNRYQPYCDTYVASFTAATPAEIVSVEPQQHPRPSDTNLGSMEDEEFTVTVGYGHSTLSKWNRGANVGSGSASLYPTTEGAESVTTYSYSGLTVRHGPTVDYLCLDSASGHSTLHAYVIGEVTSVN
jgi:hypothetical protein